MARSIKPDSLTVDEIAQLMRGVFERYAIERAILFGSFARSRQSKRSDIDLILIQKTDKPYFERFEGILEILIGLYRGGISRYSFIPRTN